MLPPPAPADVLVVDTLDVATVDVAVALPPWPVLVVVLPVPGAPPQGSMPPIPAPVPCDDDVCVCDPVDAGEVVDVLAAPPSAAVKSPN